MTKPRMRGSVIGELIVNMGLLIALGALTWLVFGR